jgi:hypothetical protein
MIHDRYPRLRLSDTLHAARMAIDAGSVEQLADALSDARFWASQAGVPWVAELGDLAEELDPALRVFRGVAGRFDALFFPEGDDD